MQSRKGLYTNRPVGTHSTRESAIVNVMKMRWSTYNTRAPVFDLQRALNAVKSAHNK